MFKRHMTPLTKGGSLVAHKGKGSQQASAPDREQISQLARGPLNSMNDYAKSTPMAQPSATPDTEGGF